MEGGTPESQRPNPLRERILKQGGFELDLGGGKRGYAALELADDQALEAPEPLSNKEIQEEGKKRKVPLTPEQEKAAQKEREVKKEKEPTYYSVRGLQPADNSSRTGVKVETVKGARSIYIREADRNFKAAFPGRDRFKRDLSDAPEDLRRSLISYYEKIQAKKPAERVPEEVVALPKLERIIQAIGYTPPPKKEDEAELARQRALKADYDKQQAILKIVAKNPALQQKPKGTVRREPRREQNDPTLDRLRKHPYWLVSDPEATGGTGIGIQVAPWYDKTDRSKGRLIGFKIMETYRSAGKINPLEYGDLLKVDENYKIDDNTSGEFEVRKFVPEELRTPYHTEKLKKLVLADRARAEVEAKAKKPEKSQPKEQPRTEQVVDQRLEELRKTPGWLVSNGKYAGVAVKVKPFLRAVQGGLKLVGFKVQETYASNGQPMPLQAEDLLKVGEDGKLLPETQRGEEKIAVPKPLQTTEIANTLRQLVEPKS